MSSEKVKQILNGKSGSFSVKEILIEHMRGSEKFREEVRTKLNFVTSNRTSIKLMCAAIGFLYVFIIVKLFI